MGEHTQGPWQIAHVRQEDPKGCALAVVAMITGLSYEQARQEYGSPGSGLTYYWWMEALASKGYAYQQIWKHSQRRHNRVQEHWPPQPWAAAHICNVDAGAGPGTHVCVMLGDGTVLDPWFEEPRKLTDYRDVAYVAAVFKVAAIARATSPDAPRAVDKQEGAGK